MKWDIIGLCEVRQKREGWKTLKSGHALYHIGDKDKRIGGIGFMINKRHKKCVEEVKHMSGRVVYLTMKLNNRYKLKVIIAYAPTVNHTDEEIDTFYDEIKIALEETKVYYNIICGNFNAKVGTKSEKMEIALGEFGLGNRNQRGETLINFLLENNLYLINSFFYKKPNKRWTWKSPDNRTKIERLYHSR